MPEEFVDLIPLIMRWIKRSRSSLVSIVNNITYFFTKTAYLNITINLGIEIPFQNVISDNILREYNIQRDQLSSFTDSSDSGSIDNLLSLFPRRTYGRHKNSTKMANYMLKVLDIAYQQACKQLRLAPKSDLKRSLLASFAKPYEIKMFIDLVCEKTNINQNSSEVKLKNLLSHGGIVGRFHTFIQRNLREMMLKIKKFSRINVPKNQEGSFYTPYWISEYMNSVSLGEFRKSDRAKSPNIADLSCGLGSFLDAMLSKFASSEMLNIFGVNYSLGNHLYGYDKNPFIIDIMRLNHSIMNAAGLNHINIANFIVQDTIMTSLEKNYDILLGNPPWGSKIDKKNVRKLKDLDPFVTQQYDSYSLFLARNLRSLADNGILYLVLPETILLNPNYLEARKYLLNKTRILEIVHLGENVFDSVNMPCIILGLKKTRPNEDHKIRILIIHDDDLKEKLQSESLKISEIIDRKDFLVKDYNITYFERIQDNFKDNQMYKFDIFTSAEEKELLSSMKTGNNWELKDLVNNSRGVEINKKGRLIQCYNCNVWQAPPKWQIEKYSGLRFTECNVCGNNIIFEKLKKKDQIIMDEFPDSDDEIQKMLGKINYDYILLGEHVHRFYLSGRALLKLDYQGVKYKSQEIYKEKKIVIRKTSKTLDACIDYDHHYTIQVVYQFSLNEQYREHKFLLEYILGVICSSSMEFFYRKTHQYEYRKSYPHHLQINILSIPIPVIDFTHTDSRSYSLYIEIVHDVLFLMLLYQLTNSDGVSQRLLKDIEIFHEIYEKTLMRLNLKDLCFRYFACSIEDVIKNPQIIREPAKYIEEFEENVNKNVQILFSKNKA